MKTLRIQKTLEDRKYKADEYELLECDEINDPVQLFIGSVQDCHVVMALLYKVRYEEAVSIMQAAS